ncbi:hypothetical protein HZC27_01855 [Candidatus Roizmanbacteria bacterium]|nr:hypothetical protein [Candidatus Roizmanbacteria bacterium]
MFNTDIVSFFTGRSLGFFFIKSFSIVFSLLFTVYAVVTFKQVQDITKAVLNERNRFIMLYSWIQIMIGIALLLYAIFFI